MVQLFFRESDGAVEKVGFCEGSDAMRRKAELVRQGFKPVAKASGKHYDFRYTVYRCRTHGKNEIYCVTVPRKIGTAWYKEVQLKLMDILRDCRFEAAVSKCTHELRGDESREIFIEAVRKLFERGHEDVINILLGNRKLAFALVGRLKRMGRSVDGDELRDIILSWFVEGLLRV